MNLEPTKKSEELVLTFLRIKTNEEKFGWSGMNKQTAKKCSLIMVNSIIKEFEKMRDNESDNNSIINKLDYWNEIRNEIIKI